MQRDKQWDSIASLHEGKFVATTWSYNKIRMGDHKLKPPGVDKGAVATCLTVTHCGNFVLIGKFFLFPLIIIIFRPYHRKANKYGTDSQA